MSETDIANLGFALPGQSQGRIKDQLDKMARSVAQVYQAQDRSIRRRLQRGRLAQEKVYSFQDSFIAARVDSIARAVMDLWRLVASSLGAAAPSKLIVAPPIGPPPIKPPPIGPGPPIVPPPPIGPPPIKPPPIGPGPPIVPPPIEPPPTEPPPTEPPPFCERYPFICTPREPPPEPEPEPSPGPGPEPEPPACPPALKHTQPVWFPAIMCNLGRARSGVGQQEFGTGSRLYPHAIQDISCNGWLRLPTHHYVFWIHTPSDCLVWVHPRFYCDAQSATNHARCFLESLTAGAIAQLVTDCIACTACAAPATGGDQRWLSECVQVTDSGFSFPESPAEKPVCTPNFSLEA